MKGQRIMYDRFTWVYHPGPEGTKKALIVSIGNSDDGPMTRGAAKLLTQAGCSVLCLAPVGHDLKYNGWQDFPLEVFECAANWLKEKGHTKIGVTGGSVTAMVSLVAAAYVPDISLVLAYTPSDFLIQGFIREKRNGKLSEWPAHDASCVTWRGKQLPYVPYGMEDEAYNDALFGKGRKEHGEIYSLQVFGGMEDQPGFEQGKIPVERIRGRVIAFGAEDDSLWYTCRYIRRMQNRLEDLDCVKDGSLRFESHLFEHGTHFVFPQKMMRAMLPLSSDWLIRFLLGRFFKAGKRYPRECEETRRRIEEITMKALREW